MPLLSRRTAFASLASAALSIGAPAHAADTIDCANASSTVEMNHCAGLDLDRADAELNAVYKKALAAIPGLAGDAPFDAKSWEAALRASQRAWVAYRDAECDGHTPMFWGGGTGTTADVLGCKTELTKKRTKQLQDRYEEK